MTAAQPLKELKPSSFEERRGTDTAADRCIKGIDSVLGSIISTYDQSYIPLTTEQHTASMYSDLLTSALQSVNWREIADHYIEAAEEAMSLEAKA